MKRHSRIRMRTALMLLAAALLVGGCVSSRYRMDLYKVSGEVRQKVDIEATAFVADTRLNDPLAENKLLPATTSSTVTISVGARGDRDGGKDLMIGFDEYLKYRILVEIPNPLKAGTVDLKGHSYVQMLKRYELPPAQKIYLPVSGELVVDSIKESDLFATLQNGLWKNPVDSTLAFEGKLKLKIKK